MSLLRASFRALAPCLRLPHTGTMFQSHIAGEEARQLHFAKQASERASAKAQQLEPPDTNAHRLSRPFPIPFFIDVYFFSIVQPVAGPPGETQHRQRVGNFSNAVPSPSLKIAPLKNDRRNDEILPDSHPR